MAWHSLLREDAPGDELAEMCVSDWLPGGVWMTSPRTQNGREPAPVKAHDRAWPECKYVGGPCLAYELSGSVGADLFSGLVAFIADSEPGARLTLQRNQSGFTLQVTGAVRRGEPRLLSPGEMSALGARFSAAGARGE